MEDHDAADGVAFVLDHFEIGVRELLSEPVRPAGLRRRTNDRANSVGQRLRLRAIEGPQRLLVVCTSEPRLSTSSISLLSQIDRFETKYRHRTSCSSFSARSSDASISRLIATASARL